MIKVDCDVPSCDVPDLAGCDNGCDVGDFSGCDLDFGGCDLSDSAPDVDAPDFDA